MQQIVVCRWIRIGVPEGSDAGCMVCCLSRGDQPDLQYHWRHPHPCIMRRLLHARLSVDYTYWTADLLSGLPLHHPVAHFGIATVSEVGRLFLIHPRLVGGLLLAWLISRLASNKNAS